MYYVYIYTRAHIYIRVYKASPANTNKSRAAYFGFSLAFTSRQA